MAVDFVKGGVADIGDGVFVYLGPEGDSNNGIVLTEEVAGKLDRGEALTPSEAAMVGPTPSMAARTRSVGTWMPSGLGGSAARSSCAGSACGCNRCACARPAWSRAATSKPRKS
mgnify:CR=1 FL=1